MRHFRLLPLTILLACAGTKGGACPVGETDGISATVDGAAWSASDVSWDSSAGVIHIVNSSEGAGWISLVAMTTTDGAEAGTALDNGELPLTVTLKAGVEGGFVVWYTEDGESASTSEGGEGTLTLSGQDGDALSGCLSFTAGPDGADVSFEDGQFTAQPQ